MREISDLYIKFERLWLCSTAVTLNRIVSCDPGCLDAFKNMTVFPVTVAEIPVDVATHTKENIHI